MLTPAQVIQSYNELSQTNHTKLVSFLESYYCLPEGYVSACITQPKIAKVMFDIGCGVMQARNHVWQKEMLRRETSFA